VAGLTRGSTLLKRLKVLFEPDGTKPPDAALAEDPDDIPV